MLTRSKDVTVAMGSNASFNCRTNSSLPIRWTHRFSATGQLTTVYNGYKIRNTLHSKYVVVNTSDGRSELTIMNVLKNDTGNLSCSGSDSVTDTEKHWFELRVLGKKILCKHFIGILLCIITIITCELKYANAILLKSSHVVHCIDLQQNCSFCVSSPRLRSEDVSYRQGHGSPNVGLYDANIDLCSYNFWDG